MTDAGALVAAAKHAAPHAGIEMAPRRFVVSHSLAAGHDLGVQSYNTPPRKRRKNRRGHILPGSRYEGHTAAPRVARSKSSWCYDASMRTTITSPTMSWQPRGRLLGHGESPSGRRSPSSPAEVSRRAPAMTSRAGFRRSTWRSTRARSVNRTSTPPRTRTTSSRAATSASELTGARAPARCQRSGRARLADTRPARARS